ncbi:MAG TPA: 30S ribosomal protein S6 [Kofleriaceae bacterium]|nr:30S ribosomal protein S6 [Kofleriaceae bacterium]
MQHLESLADAPGTMRAYETVYVLRGDSTNDQVAEVNTRVRGIIETMGGKIIKVDNWGKRRLAYEIKKERKGIYLYWNYLAGAGVVEEFERNLRMLDSVVRYLTVKRQANMVPDQVATEVTEESYEKAAATAADEEDMYLRRPEGEGDEEAAGGYGDDYGDDDDFTEDAKEEEPAEEDDSKKDEE